MRTVSKKLIYHAEKLVNQQFAEALLADDYLRTSRGANGLALYNFSASEIHGKTSIVGIDASIANNYSSSKRFSSVIFNLDFYYTTERSINFLQGINESFYDVCDLKFEGSKIFDRSDTNLEFSYNDHSLVPENVISFNAWLDPADIDADDTLFFLPTKFYGKPSIVDKLHRFYSTSFTESSNINTRIEIPSQANYLLVFPNVTLPIPGNRITRLGIKLIRTGNISAGALLNLRLEEEERGGYDYGLGG
ncbi:MAG: hypothetical protein AAF518_14480 [Spirochaetota bacterium]